MKNDTSTEIAADPLPPEIIDVIIDQLHDDMPFLRTCSLTSKQFASRAQKHLFCTIQLIFPHPSDRHPANGLLNVFDTNPSLARHVEHLYITNYLEGVWDSKTQEFCRATDEILPRLFSHLRSLKNFLLESAPALMRNPGSTDKKYLNELSVHLISALLQMFQSNKLTGLTLKSITNFPIIYLSSTCANLKRLSLTFVHGYYTIDDAAIYEKHFPPIHDLGLPTSNSSSKVEVLKIDSGSAVAVQKLYKAASHPHSRFTFSHLRRIELRGHNISVRKVVAALIVDAASTLEEFDWNHNFYANFPDFEYIPIDVGPTTSLRVLRLACAHTPEIHPEHLDWVFQSLGAIRGHNHLEHISIKLYCGLSDVDDFDWCESADWAASFDLLLAADDFELLERVTIFIHLSGFETTGPFPFDGYVRVKKSLENRLPLLRQKGVLSVE